MNFKSAIPNEFVDFVREAQDSKERGNTSLEELALAPAALTILEVVSLCTSLRLHYSYPPPPPQIDHSQKKPSLIRVKLT